MLPYCHSLLAHDDPLHSLTLLPSGRKKKKTFVFFAKHARTLIEIILANDLLFLFYYSIFYMVYIVFFPSFLFIPFFNIIIHFFLFSYHSRYNFFPLVISSLLISLLNFHSHLYFIVVSFFSLIYPIFSVSIDFIPLFPLLQFIIF